MATCHFEAYSFVPVQRELLLHGASTVDVRLSTSFATVTTVLLHEGNARTPVARKVVPTTGVNEASVSFTDVEQYGSLNCEVLVDAELGSARVSVQVDY